MFPVFTPMTVSLLGTLDLVGLAATSLPGRAGLSQPTYRHELNG